MRPIIPIRLIYRHRELTQGRYSALIDSGADWCLFHAEVAALLGIECAQGDPHPFVGVEGIQRTAFFHSVQLIVGSSLVSIRAGFVERFPFAYGLLGQAGFFDSFLVTFNKELASPYVEIIRRQ